MLFGLILAGALFFLSFPNPWSKTGFEFLAWIFAVPIFVALEKQSLGRRVLVGLFFGLFTYLATLYWMAEYSWVAYPFLSFVFSIQPILFCLLYRTDFKWPFITIPCCWVVSEWIRRVLMGGLSWDLAHTQTFNLPLLQLVSVGGSSMLSYVLIYGNYGLYHLIRNPTTIKEKRAPFIIMVVVVTICYGLGFMILRQEKISEQWINVASIQPNTDFRRDLNEADIKNILEQNIAMTNEAVKERKPDVVIWPETSIPDDILQSSGGYRQLQAAIRTIQVPVIMGTVISYQKHLYNAAVYFDRDGQVKQIYFKKHLIPFAEFIPDNFMGRLLAGFISRGNHFSTRDSSSIMNVAGIPAMISICSEDNIGSYFQKGRDQNAALGIVLLNNGWFSHQHGMIMHGQNSMMRAVENGMSIIRVSNNGWSCWIDPYGRIKSNGFDQLQKSAIFYDQIPVSAFKTPYYFLRDTFCLLCLAFVIISYGLIILKKG